MKYFEALVDGSEAIGPALPEGQEFGYQVYPVLPERADRNSVLFVIQPGGGTPLVEVLGPIRMKVQGLAGKVVASVYNRDAEAWTEHTLAEDKPVLELGQGQAYTYRNDGRDVAVIRDDCTPPYQEGFEREVPNTRSLLLPPTALLG